MNMHRESRSKTKPVYIRFNTNKVERTEEVAGDAEVLMDFDADGNLIGIEILSPFTVEDAKAVIGEKKC